MCIHRAFHFSLFQDVAHALVGCRQRGCFGQRSKGTHGRQLLLHQGQTLRAQGLDEEADKQEVILEYARNAARIRGDGSLTDDDRRNRLSTNEARRAQALGNLDLASERAQAEAAADAADTSAAVSDVVKVITPCRASAMGDSPLRPSVPQPGTWTMFPPSVKSICVMVPSMV